MRTQVTFNCIREIEYKFANPVLAFKDMIKEGTIKGLTDEEIIYILHQLKSRHLFESFYIKLALKVKAFIQSHFMKEEA